jgi:hypothetical protein
MIRRRIVLYFKSQCVDNEEVERTEDMPWTGDITYPELFTAINQR